MMPVVPAAASRGSRGVAISAHRGGGETAPEGTYDAYQAALEAGADYLEFDVRRTADGELVAFHAARLRPASTGQHSAGQHSAGQHSAGQHSAGQHSAGQHGARQHRAVSALSYAELCRLAGYLVPTTSGLLGLLAGRAGAHIDLKEPDCLGVIVSQALGVLTPERIIVTTGSQSAVAELGRRWPAVPAGLTIGGAIADTARYLARRARLPIQSPVDAVIAAGAGWAVVHERLARAGGLVECRRRGLATMVWTVNDDTALSRWLGCPDVDVVVTDRPRRAAALRGQSSQASN
jgi:glycerophosphoryl diester phosphodiesterase